VIKDVLGQGVESPLSRSNPPIQSQRKTRLLMIGVTCLATSRFEDDWRSVSCFLLPSTQFSTDPTCTRTRSVLPSTVYLGPYRFPSPRHSSHQHVHQADTKTAREIETPAGHPYTIALVLSHCPTILFLFRSLGAIHPVPGRVQTMGLSRCNRRE